GYGADRASAAVLALLGKSGASIQRWIDVKIWQEGIPGALYWMLSRVTRAFAWFDGRLIRAVDAGVRRSTEGPAKLLQLIQSGELQWYLFFAIGSGFAVLLHFLTRGQP